MSNRDSLLSQYDVDEPSTNVDGSQRQSKAAKFVLRGRRGVSWIAAAITDEGRGHFADTYTAKYSNLQQATAGHLCKLLFSLVSQ